MCLKRYIVKQPWKTKKELELCLTCSILKQAVIATLAGLKTFAASKDIDLDLKFNGITLKPLKK